ncbi:terpene synthase family protein [Streptomyces sp. NPDC086554]|uniref:terpene synthase family protein n=1 Tax=Streptomyces sp. NPDC086554 TaxID=3154864 RepID=UPI0034207344
MSASPVLPYTIPSLYCPPVPPRHRHAEEIKHLIDLRFAEYGLRAVPEYAAAYDSLEMSELFVRCHPVGDVEALLSIAPFFVIAGLEDKPQSSEAATHGLPGMAGQLLRASADQVVALVTDPGAEELVADPLAKAFLRANRDLAEFTTAEKLHLQVTRFLEWITIEHRLTGQETAGYRPPLTEALSDRLTSVALPLIEAFTAAAFPTLTVEQILQPPAATIWKLVAVAAAAHNDLFSGYAEHDVDSNLVNTFAREDGISMQQAAERLADLADRAMAETQRRLDDLADRRADPVLVDFAATAVAHPITAVRWFYPRQMTRRYQVAGLDLTHAAQPLTSTPKALGAPGITAIDHLWTSAEPVAGTA